MPLVSVSVLSGSLDERGDDQWHCFVLCRLSAAHFFIDTPAKIGQKLGVRVPERGFQVATHRWWISLTDVVREYHNMGIELAQVVEVFVEGQGSELILNPLEASVTRYSVRLAQQSS